MRAMHRAVSRAALIAAVSLTLPHVAPARPARPAAAAAAAANVMLPQMPSISPDGQSVVFSWHGDLWKVAADGGTAQRLTSNPAEETYSRFGPDGRTIAFNSDRRGSAGIYTMNADGTGVSEVLAGDRPALLSDYSNGTLLFTGYVEPDVYRNPRPYQLPAGGGVFTRTFDAFGRNPVLEPGGKRILFTRGNFSWDRRHYTGADSREVWLFDPDAADKFTQLTTWKGNDGRARWAGKDRVIYTSDRADGTVNLFLMDLTAADAEKDARRLTHFTDRDVEEFDVTPDGKTAVFSRWDTLYTLDLTKANAEPVALKIKAAEDERDAVKYVDVEGKANEAKLSPDGKTFAFIAYGQLYVRGVEDAANTRRIGDGLHRRKQIAWSPDGGTLYYTSDESGKDAVYAVTVSLTRGGIREAVEKLPATPDAPAGRVAGPGTQPTTKPADADVPRAAATMAATQATSRLTTGSEGGQESPADGRLLTPVYAPDPAKWADAVAFHAELVSGDAQSDSDPVPSPDGTRLALTRGPGQLVVLDLETGKETVAFDGWSNSIQYLWSPDSKHLIYSTEDANFNQDIWVTRADGTGHRGTGRPMNLTQHPDDDINMSLSADGRVLAFSSERVGEEYDVWSVYLDEELETLAPAELEEYYKSLAEKVKKSKPIAVPAFAKARGTVSPLSASTRPTSGSAPAMSGKHPASSGDDPATSGAHPASSGNAPVSRETHPASSGNNPASSGTHPAPSGNHPATRGSTPEPANLGVAALRKALRDFILDESPQADGDAKPKTEKAAGADKPNPSLDDFACATAYLRLRRVSRDAGNETNLVLLPDASAVYYTSGGTLYKQPWKGERAEAGKAVNLVAAAPDAQSLVFLAGGKGGVQKLAGNARTAVGPEDRLEVDLAEQNEVKFRELARTLGMLFYSPTMKGTDWPALVEQYAPLARAARTPDEFEHVSMKLLGELNASHLGVYAPNDARPESRTFGRLGLRTEPVANGFEVLDVLETGPTGRGEMKLIPGDVVTKLELEPVDKNEAFDLQLADKAGREVVVTVERDGTALNLLLTPVSYAAISDLSYDAWRLDNLRKVEKLSDGRLGYIHVRAMDQASLDVFERDLYAAAAGKEGLLVDVRHTAPAPHPVPPAIERVAELSPGASPAVAQHGERQPGRRRHGEPPGVPVAGDQQLVALVQVDRQPGAVAPVGGRAGGRALVVQHAGVGREADPHPQRPTALAPLHLLAVEEVILAHRPDRRQEASADQHGAAGHVGQPPLHGAGVHRVLQPPAVADRHGAPEPRPPAPPERPHAAVLVVDHARHQLAVAARQPADQRGQRVGRGHGVGVQDPPAVRVRALAQARVDPARIAQIAWREQDADRLPARQRVGRSAEQLGVGVRAAVLAHHDLELRVRAAAERGQAGGDVVGVAIAHDGHGDVHGARSLAGRGRR